jgi:hypothetical protein
MALPDVKQFSTEDLDALRDAIALERIKRKPEITMAQPITMEAAVDPRWYITLGEAGTFLQLRHPGYGWVGYLIPPPARAQLASYLLQHALMPALRSDAPKPDVSAGGGTVH